MAEKEILRWPDWMPKPQRNGYSYEPTDRRSRSDMEVGSVMRVNFDTDETVVSCTLMCNQVQGAWFEEFEHTMLNQGSKWFEVPLQSGGQIKWHKARFASRPKASGVLGVCGTQYTLKLDISGREGRMCKDLAELLLCIPPCEVKQLSTEMQEATNGMDCSLTELEIPDFWNHYCRKKRVRYELGL